VKRGAATNFAGENLATVASLLATPHRAPKLSLGADRQQLSPELSADFHSNFSLLLPSLFFPV